jgi:hypothetical protein
VKYKAKDAAQTVPAGVYDASIKAYTETKKDGSQMQTKSGDPMCMVTFEVYVGERTRFVSDYFSAGSMLWKYKNLAKAICKEDEFKAETFTAEDYIGENLQLELTVEDDEKYGEQNRIKKFMPKRAGVVARANVGKVTPDTPIDDSSIPF